MAKLTIMGFNSYMKSAGDDLFKNLTVPDGIDKDTLTDNILLRGAEFEVLYSNPYFMQDAIGVWSKKWQRTMTKWAEALAIEYEPLENYDRHEDWTDTGSGHSADTSNGTGATSAENRSSGYDSGYYTPDTSESSNSTNSNTSNSDTSNTSTHSGRLHGNIGVTTSQQMLQSELDISAWNIYENITTLFLSEFVIPLY